MKYPVFPLPIILLPNGVTRLRIFEPRYVRMVKEVMQADNCFILAMNGFADGEDVYQYGTKVRIVDFDQGSDGLLNIDIQGIERVAIENITVDDDGLRMGEVNAEPSWQISEAYETSAIDLMLAEELSDLFNKLPELKKFYQPEQLQDPVWVAQRWLEILPIPLSSKALVAYQQSFAQCQNFLHTIFKEHSSH